MKGAAEISAAKAISSPSTDADKADEPLPATLQKSHDGLKKEEEVGFICPPNVMHTGFLHPNPTLLFQGQHQ